MAEIDLDNLAQFAGKTDFEKESAKYMQTHPRTYVVNGKDAYFARLDKDNPRIFFLPLIFKESSDLAQFPMHSYIKVGADESQSFMCRGFIGEECPICRDGFRASQKFMFRAIPAIEVGAMTFDLMTDSDGSYRIEYVTIGKNAEEQLEDIKATNGNYISTFVSYSKKGEGLRTSYTLLPIAPAIKQDKGKTTSILQVEPLKKGLAKYPDLEDYVLEMTSDTLYSKYHGVIE